VTHYKKKTCLPVFALDGLFKADYNPLNFLSLTYGFTRFFKSLFRYKEALQPYD